MRLTKKIILLALVFIAILDVYNIFFRYTYHFDKNDFDKPVELFCDARWPLKSTVHITGNFNCPAYMRQGYKLEYMQHRAELVGKVDTVINTDFYNGNYLLVFENEECIDELDKIRLRVYNIDFTFLRLLSNQIPKFRQ
jgi:hypothetical protein